MIKITFVGAGSSVFAKNVLGDCMCTPVLQSALLCLYDIDADRLEDSRRMLEAINKNINQGRATIVTFLGEENRKAALKDANFVVNAIQVGGYEPCTVTDFEIPKKYGIEQTIGDTLGIGGIMRALRTIPVMFAFAKEMEEVCPNAWLLNYTNPMAILAGFLQRYTKVKVVGLCHSVQGCSKDLLKALDMEDKLEGRKEVIAGINHMSWLLEIQDKDGNDLYPEIKKRGKEKNATEKHGDMVRYDYMDKFGYYCTESSEHNAEYNPYYIKPNYPELIARYNIPLDEYPRRCRENIEKWAEIRKELIDDHAIDHTRSHEYASYIMEAIVTNQPYQIGGNVLNHGLIENLVNDACVEVPCLVDGMGVHPCKVGRLPEHLAALNMTNINPQLLTIKAAYTQKREDIYKAAMLEPRVAALLSLEDIIKLCDELIDAHGEYMAMYR